MIDLESLKQAIAFGLCPDDALYCRERMVEDGDVDSIIDALRDAGFSIVRDQGLEGGNGG